MTTYSRADATYVLGHSNAEHRRLAHQAGFFGEFSRRFLQESGIRPGMRVLDIGCGTGEVSLLCAELVGAGGHVVGIDRDAAALTKARDRAAAEGFRQISFREGDFRTLAPDGLFDAVVGRAVLMYLGNPLEAIECVTERLRPGGVAAFQEFDFTWASASPPSPIHTQIANWWRQTAAAAGIHLQMGVDLHRLCTAAGLTNVRIDTKATLGGGADFEGYAYLTNGIRSILPYIQRFGIATADEVDVDTLAERLRAEVVKSGGCVALPMLIGAAGRKP